MVNKLIFEEKLSKGIRPLQTRPLPGWTNQPNVIVFEASKDMVEDIAAEVSRSLGTDWIHIGEKDW